MNGMSLFTGLPELIHSCNSFRENVKGRLRDMTGQVSPHTKHLNRYKSVDCSGFFYVGENKRGNIFNLTVQMPPIF